MQRITDKDLDKAVERLNKAKGTPIATWTRDNEGKSKANIGNYYVEGAYGGVKLVQVEGEGGSIRVISQGGYGTKRELYNIIHSMLQVLGG